MPPWKGIIAGAHTPASFAAYVQTVKLQSWRPQFCVLHNTGVPQFKDWHKVPGPTRMKALESYYRDVQHWSGGPHLFVADDYLWTFTPLWLPGVHAPSWNGLSWGIETVGDYDVEPLNAGVYSNAIAALAILHRFGNLNPSTLKFHREDPKTTHYGCPGKNMPGKAFVISSIRQALGQSAQPDFSDVRSGHSTTATTSRPLLKRGSKDPENVMLLQHLLGMRQINAPGTFGPLTEQAVKDFQASHGLDADGIVGPETWRELEVA